MKYTTPWCMHMALIIQFLLASMLVLRGAESSEYYRRTELIHVDANGGFTRGELIRRAAERAYLRVAMLSSADTQGIKVEVNSPYEYLMTLEVEMDGKPQRFNAVADTGSSIVWMKKEMAQPGIDVKPVPCKCPLFPFTTTYGGRGIKAAKGFMCTEQKLSFLSPSETVAKKDNINMGFAIHYDHDLMPASADGIAGLSNTDTSLVWQLKVNKFSYCLSNPLTGKPTNSPFWFGGDPNYDAHDSELKSTPLVQVKPMDRYHVELLGISVGGGERKELTGDYFNHKSKQGNGVMFIDTGCSRTVLETRVFRELKNQLVEKLGNFKLITKDDKVHTCFPKKAPIDLVLHFNGAQMRIPWDNYMLQLQDDKPESDFCLAINETNTGVSILGNHQQHNIYMHYDISPEPGKLSFKQVDCSKLQ